MVNREPIMYGRLSGLMALLIFYLLAFSTFATAQDNSTFVTRISSDSGTQTVYTGDSSTRPPESISTSVSLSNALSAASTAAAQQSQISSMPPIPLPTNDPQYRTLLQLAPAMPPLQRTSANDATPPDGAAAGNSTLAARSEDELEAMLQALKAARPSWWRRMMNKRSSSLRVLCVGDSMSQGQQGDWTWRYRIWQWFRANNIDVTFVGPWAGTVKPPTAGPPVPPPLYGSTPPSSLGSFDGGYAASADSGWSGSGHFSAWGRAAATDQYLIKQIVQDYSPDLMLLMLGFNDLGWFYSDPSGTLNSVYNIMTNARSANPSLAFAIANIPQRSSLNRRDLPANTETYNGMLAKAIPSWSTGRSPVGLVRLRENYGCDVNNCPAGYDGLHPNALGEYQIAQAFSQTLFSSFGYGTGPLTIPGNIPARPLPAPSNFKVQTSPQGVTATWDPVYGAYAYEVMSRIDGVTDFTSGSVPSNRYDQHWPLENATYSYYVRATAGNQVGPWTQTLSAVAHPQTAPAPLNVYVKPTDTGTTITWDRPTGPYTDSITLYNVITWDLDTDCTFISGAAFKSSPAVITGLNVGHRYLIALETWNANGEGFPMVAHNVVPGYGTPGLPTGFNLISQDATSVYATWDRTANAGGYNVYVRNNYTNGTFSNNGGQSETCFVDYFLFPGSWHYQFAVSSYNGNLESYAAPYPYPYAPHPNGTMNPAPTCPAPKPWCAGGGQPWGPAPEDPGQTGQLPGTGPGSGGGGGARLTTLTTTINGKPTTIVETIITTVTTDAVGHTITEVIIEPSATGVPPAGASVTTLTSVGPDGTTTLLIETIFPYTTTNPQGATVTATSTGPAAFPPPDKSTTVITTTGADGKPTTVTDTIRPTTTTYHGTTYTGTITQGPTTTTTSGAPPLVYYSTFDWNKVSWSTTNVQYNTRDSSNHPVLGPWPPCFFCPPSFPGIDLFGVDFPPGIYPPGPPPGIDSAPWPRITIGPDHIPTFSSDPGQNQPTNTDSPTTTTSSCQSTQTGVQCYNYCGPTTINGQSTTTCSSSTCYTGVPACTAGTSTSTVSTAASDFACPAQTRYPLYDPNHAPYGGCYSCDSPVFNYGAIYYNGDDSNDYSGLDRRSDNASAYLHPQNLERRRPKLSTVTAIPSGAGLCTYSTPVAFPTYTGGFDFLQAQTAGALRPAQTSYTSFFVSTVAGCTPTIIPLSGQQMVAIGNQAGGNFNNPSIDHVWEKKWMKGFLSSVLNTNGGPSCNDFNAIFFPSNGNNCLQPIYDAIPGDPFWDMLPMDTGLNNAKADVANFEVASKCTDATNALTNQLQALGNAPGNAVDRAKAFANAMVVFEREVIACQAWSLKEVSDLFAITNRRIYARLLDIDTSIKVRNLPVRNFAGSYKAWMIDNLDRMTNQADPAISTMKNRLVQLINQVNPSGPGQLQSGAIVQNIANYQNILNSSPSTVCRFTLNYDWNNPDPEYGGGPNLSNCGTPNYVPGAPPASAPGGSIQPTSQASSSTGPTTGPGTVSPTPTTTAPTATSATARSFPTEGAAFNVYSDDNCQNLVGGYDGSACYNTCCAFPQQIRSYQFVSKNDGCNPSNPRTCGVDVNFYSSGSCSGASVATECGNVKTCKKATAQGWESSQRICGP